MSCISRDEKVLVNPCSNPCVGDSNFCKYHSAMFKSDYIKYKKMEHGLDNINLTDNNINITYLLKIYNKLSKAYQLRIDFRNKAIYPTFWDKGHTLRIDNIYNMMEICLNLIE